MEVITISASAIVPLLLFMALGYFFKKRNYLNAASAKQLNIICFRYFLSVYSGVTIYKADLRQGVDIVPVIFVAVSLTLVFAISWLIVPRFEKDKTRIPVIIQGLYKSNFAILGIPIAEAICGGDISVISMIMIVLVPLNNSLSAWIFERYTGKATSKLDLILKILKNPLVLGSLVGLVLNLIKFPIPAWLLNGFISKLGSLTTPLSLIALGATFEFGFVKKYRKTLTTVCLVKLIFTPLVVISAAIACGLRGPGLVGVMIFATAPNAVNSYSTAVAMGGDADLANEIVVLTSIFSMITMFAWFCLVGFVVGF